MRRLALSLMASCGLAMLAACSGGTGFAGNGTTNPKIDGIYFTNGSAQVNDFILAPTGNSPILVNAVAYKGSGAFNNVVPDVTFTWQAGYGTGQTYQKGTSPNGSTTCLAPPVAAQGTPPIAAILQQGPGGQNYGPSATFMYGGAYTQLSDQANPVGSTPNYNTNPPVYIQQTDHVYVAPVLTLTPGGTESATPLTPPYCITLIATAVGSGVSGKIVIAVTN